MAAEAFAAGDYENSVRLYELARSAAAANDDDEAWISCTLALARAKVRLGDAAGARKLLDEFTKRHPAHSPGLLPGEIFAAEGKVSEAKAYFRSFIDLAKDPGDRAAAELAMAYLELRFGSAASAVESLAVLERDPLVGSAARSLRIYGMIRVGRPDEAKKLLAAIPAEKRGGERIRLRILALLADLREGRTESFASEWQALRPELKPHPDPLILDMLDEAAKLALRDKSPEFAAQLLSAAYDFADRDEIRKDILRRLFNCYAEYDAKLAASAAKRYVGCFPGAPDRAQFLSGAGRLLVGAGDPKAALEFFEKIIDDRELTTAERRDAAYDAALAAEKCGDAAAAKRYYGAMIESADSAEEQNTAIIAFAEYLLRRREYPEAEGLLRRAAGSAVRSIADRAEQLLVQALIPQGKFSAALPVAERLKDSAKEQPAEFGLFHTAFLAEKLGDAETARKRYLEFIAKYPKSDFLREARFSAALIALNSGDYPAAAREFFGYAADYPLDPSCGSALFWAVRGSCFAGDIEGARRAFAAMKEPIPAYYAAALQLLEALRSAGQFEAGLEFWNSLDRTKCGDGESAALLLCRACLLKDCGRREDAVKELATLIERFKKFPLAADAALLAGDLYFDRGEYPKALESFRSALEKRPSGVFAEVVSGRIGDTLLAQYGSAPNGKLLREAVGIFGKLSRESVVPAIRLQSYWKLGRCLQELRDFRRAVAACEQALLYADGLRKQGIAFDPEWCSRSVYTALSILQTSHFSNRRQQGQRIIDSYRNLELKGADEEMAAVEKEFNERCNMEM